MQGYWFPGYEVGYTAAVGTATWGDAASIIAVLLVGYAAFVATGRQRKAAIRPVVIYRRDGTQNNLVNAGVGTALNVECWLRMGAKGARGHADSIGLKPENHPLCCLSPAPDRVWIRYTDAEGTYYHSVYDPRDTRRPWRSRRRRGPKPDEPADGWCDAELPVK